MCIFVLFQIGLELKMLPTIAGVSFDMKTFKSLMGYALAICLSFKDNTEFIVSLGKHFYASKLINKQCLSLGIGRVYQNGINSSGSTLRYLEGLELDLTQWSSLINNYWQIEQALPELNM